MATKEQKLLTYALALFFSDRVSILITFSTQLSIMYEKVFLVLTILYTNFLFKF